MSTKKIGLFVGSLRKESFSKKLANAILPMASSGFEFEIVDISELPIYNQDFDDHGPAPASYATFREKVRGLSGFIFVTPEYNRSLPAVLKNALDVGSRPYGQSVWDNKPGAVFSLSPSSLSGFGANHHLRQSLVFLNVLVMQQPEVYLANIANALGADGSLSDESVKGFVQKAVDAFQVWADRVG